MKHKTNKPSTAVNEAVKDHPPYFFAWTKVSPYITKICAWTRRDAIAAAVKAQCAHDWKSLYANGGRIVKVRMILDSNKNHLTE